MRHPVEGPSGHFVDTLQDGCRQVGLSRWCFRYTMCAAYGLIASWCVSAAERTERWWPMLMRRLNGKMPGKEKNVFFAQLVLGRVHVPTFC